MTLPPGDLDGATIVIVNWRDPWHPQAGGKAMRTDLRWTGKIHIIPNGAVAPVVRPIPPDAGPAQHAGPLRLVWAGRLVACRGWAGQFSWDRSTERMATLIRDAMDRRAP